jgi:asparagine synthase (glutamine-hydrolysing)
MCGIAGWVRRVDPVDIDVVARQLDLLLHRGPDAHGTFARGRGAVGQTRLSIIDLRTGDPPIATPDDQIGVALNGEIYNYREIRAELLADGHQLHTVGDTEVIAHLAEHLEPADVARALHGMFAFAVWDARRERLILGRDRVGKKPLYWWSDGSQLVFASEIKALLAHPAVPARLDAGAIPGFLTYGYASTPRTFYEGIVSVPPGHVLVVERDFTIRTEQYWRPVVPGMDGTTRLELSERDAAREVRRLLTTAVERRLVADVPLGAFLSGGVDSSAVVALMARASPDPVRTFTIGFEDRDGFDEREHARLVAEHVGTDHTELVVHPDAVDLIERIVWHHDQPFGDSSSIPTFLLSELTREHVTVALCGDGGDELFAGYDRFRGGVIADRLSRIPRRPRRAMASLMRLASKATGSYRVERLRRFAAAADLGLPDAYRSWLALTSDEDRRALTGVASDWSDESWHAVWDESRGADTLDRLLHLNLRTYLLDDLLPKVDRMAMANALEVRAPFLDHELIELALRLPPSAKVRGMSAKRVLKAAIEDLVPRSILDRPKRGFAVPLDRWFRDDLAGYVDAMLLVDGARVRQHLKPDAIDRIVAEHRSGTSHGHLLWSLLTLEVFLRRHDW